MLSDDIRAFFMAIGVNDDVELIPLPSDARQQNIKVQALGIEWVFRQERGDQDVVMQNPSLPDVGISVQQMGFFFRPPTEQEICQIAQSTEFPTRYATLSDASAYIRGHLPEIIELISTDRIVVAAAEIEMVIKSIFDAVEPAGG